MNAVFALYTVIASSLCLSTATRKLAGPEASFKKYIETSYFCTARDRLLLKIQIVLVLCAQSLKEILQHFWNKDIYFPTESLMSRFIVCLC